MRKIYLMLLALVIVTVSYAQVARTYTFSQSTGTYTPITGGTVYGNASSDDQKFVNPAMPLGDTVSTGVGIPIGFNFTFNGQSFDRIAINYNGWISFGSSSLTPSVNNQPFNEYDLYAIESPNLVNPAVLRNRVAGLNIDLEAGTSSQLRVQTLGSGSNQVCVIQWSNVHEYDFSNESFSFQIRLIQATGAVQVVYGPNTRTTDQGSDPQVGLGGTTSSDFNNRSGATWTTTTAGTTNSDVIYFYSASVPPSGLTYTWTVASCISPATLSFTSTTVPNVAISWTAVPGAAGYEYKIDTTAGNPTSGTTTTTSTTGTATNIPPGSVVFAHVRTNCGSSFSAWITRAYVPCTTNITPAANATNIALPPSFSFNTVAGATAYRIFISSDAGVTYPLSAIVPTSPVSLNGLSYSTTYRWFVRAIAGSDTAAATCASNATSFTTQAAPPPPANDNCAGAITINPYVAPIAGTTISATQSLAPAACAGGTSATAYDVWYRITATSAGSFTINVTGNNNFDAAIGIYRGTCGSLTFDTCRDVGFAGQLESVTVTNAVAGTTYFIRVYDYSGTTVTDSVGTFTISASGLALPVTGISLSAIRNGSKAQLSWKTLTEVNNAGFEIQRSADGKNFTGIASMTSKATSGNSTAAITYNFDDIRPFAGANYYRLKQTDKDGKISYSNIVYLKGIAVSTLTVSAIYPNPTRDVLKAAVQAPAAESITFVVTDMMGKTISRQIANVISGDNTVNINVANLPSGSYLLKAICRNGCETAYQKFTKQ